MDRMHGRGPALVLVAGILSLLAILGAGWAILAKGLRERTGVELDRTHARLLAHYGT